MDKVWNDSFDANLKSAFCNLKSAILLCSWHFALCALHIHYGSYSNIRSLTDSPALVD
jgi:hypothetical protein